MEFRILGPLTVESAGREAPVGSAKLRTVLAYLLIHARQLVTTDALIEEVWAGNPPRSAANTIQTYISQLRQLLEPERPPRAQAGTLRTVPCGYLLDVEPSMIDHFVFERALHDGRAAVEAGEFDDAVDRLRDGLSRWRGPALGNVTGSAARSAGARLDELRLEALELRLEAELARGRHDEVVGELEQLVREHPWRERFIGQLMVALYRSGRQAEALACYRTARQRLVDELGIAPGPALQDVQRQILRQQADLDPADTRAAPDGPARQVRTGTIGAPATAGPRRAPWRTVAAAVALTIAVALVVVVALSGHADDAPRGAVSRSAPVATPDREFDLAVRAGTGYDLDAGAARSPARGVADLYRTSPDAKRDQISGSPARGTDDFNPIYLVSAGDPPTICRRLPEQGGGFIALRDLRVGARACLWTHDGHWAMLRVTRMPESRAAVLFLHVTVLGT